MSRTLKATAVAVATLLLVPLVLLALLGLLVGWPKLASDRLDKVDVTWAGPPKCTGTDVEWHNRQDPTPVVVASPSMHCVVTVRIINRGEHEVTVNRLIAPFLGPETGTSFTGAPLDGVEPRPEPTFGIDAIYDLDMQLAGGALKTMEVAFVFNEGSCAHTSNFSATNWPVVEVSALGKSEERASSEALHIRDLSKFHHCGAK
jgi:hypothetical protein